jgi:hypothetical protein
VWIDTDTVLLRDIVPVVEYAGEFGGRFAMTQKNNNVRCCHQFLFETVCNDVPCIDLGRHWIVSIDAC